MTRQQRLCAIIAATLLAATTVAQAQILANGSFETGDFYAWEVSGNASEGQTVYGTTDGIYAVSLNSGDVNVPSAILTQTFSTVPGWQYMLGLDLGAFGDAKPVVLSAKVLGLDQAPVLNESAAMTTYRYWTEWTHAEWSFVANSSSSTLVLQDLTPDGIGTDGVLDNVTVTVVPEPVTGGLLAALGLVGLAAWRKNRT